LQFSVSPRTNRRGRSDDFAPDATGL
jgi:hypothetical protein